MIDWPFLVISALWILGLAELLTVLSIAYWTSGTTATPLRRVLEMRPFRGALVVGIVLFALGMFLGAEAWWEKGLWGVVMVLTLWDGVDARRKRPPTTDR